MGAFVASLRSRLQAASLRRPSFFVASALVAGYLGLLALTVWQDYERTAAEARTQGHNAVRLISGLIAKTVEDIEFVLQSTERRAQGFELPPPRPGVQLTPQSLDVFAWNSFGDLRLGSTDRAPAVQEAIRDAVMAGATGLTIGKPLRTSSGWVLVFARRAPTGWLIATTISAEQFSTVLHLVDVREFGTIGVNALDGTLLLREPYRDDQVGIRFDRSALFTTHLRARPSGTGDIVFYATDQSRRLVAFDTVANAPMVVAVTRPWDDILQSWRRTLWLSVAAGGAVLLIVPLSLVLLLRWARRVEAAEQARALAEAASRMKSEFLAMMSHELRTPMNAVLGFAEIIRDQRFGPIGQDRYAAYASDIHASGTHLLSVLNDILDVAKIEAGKMSIHPELVPLAQAVAASTRLARGHFDASRAVLEVDTIAPDAAVFADPRALRQVLVNVLSNAAKFTPAGKRVRLTASLAADGAVTLTIADEGIGMTPAELESALKPFAQVESIYTRKTGGTGLGLPIIRGLMDLHGGSFEIQSARDQGTTVRLVFPGPVAAPATPAAMGGD